MSGGIFRIILDDKVYSLGNITDISTSLTTTMISATIPTQPYQNRFVADSGVRQSVRVEFTRAMPSNIDEQGDSTQWSNGKWIQEMVKLINRWQMETDGVEIYYLIKDAEEMYPSIGFIINDAIVGVNAYISEFSPKYDSASPFVIRGSIRFDIGGINANLIGDIRPTVIYTDGVSNFGYMYDSSQTEFTVASVPPSWGGATSWKAIDSKGNEINLNPGTVVRFTDLKIDSEIIYKLRL